MPSMVTDAFPADVVAQDAAYVDALNQVIPPKGNQNLLIGIWNIRAFNLLTARWRWTKGYSPLLPQSHAGAVMLARSSLLAALFPQSKLAFKMSDHYPLCVESTFGSNGGSDG